MIYYYVEYVLTSRWAKRSKAVAHSTTVDPIPCERKLFRFGNRRKRSFTTFDDSSQPPRLLREDYSPQYLHSIGADVPELYLDGRGNLCKRDGSVVFAGLD